MGGKPRIAWAARCCCYNDHPSTSGRCVARDVSDPTRKPGEGAKCEYCRKHCTTPKVPKTCDECGSELHEGTEGVEKYQHLLACSQHVAPPRWFVCVAPHHWGRGETLLEAEAQLKLAGGTVGKRGEDSHCYLIPEGAMFAWVEPMGDIAWQWPKDHPIVAMPWNKRPTTVKVY